MTTGDSQEQGGERTVTACPECGHQTVYNCYHAGEQVATEKMPVSKALELAKYSLETAEASVEEWKSEVEELEKLKNG